MANAVVKARVVWYGQNTVGGGASCDVTMPMHSLEIEDDVSRMYMVYEETDINDIGFNQDFRLKKRSRDRIEGYVPLLSSMPVQSGASQHWQAAEHQQSGYNHGGSYVGNDQAPVGQEEECRWASTLEEVGGFEWTAPKEAEDLSPPGFRVVGIRRAFQKVFAIVHTTQGDSQHDHPLTLLRRRIFFSVVADHVKHRLPYMMGWEMMEHSSLILSNDIILANARFYETIVRWVCM